MFEKIITTLIMLMYIPLWAMGQAVTGRIVDDKSNPIPSVNCVLLSVDSVFITGSISDNNGHFTILAQSDKDYILSISCISYESISQLCKVGNVGTIVLKENTQMLSEVAIVGKRIKYKSNGYTINLKNESLAKGKQATELLAFLPGVTMEGESVKVLSQSPHAIYVDGIKIQNNSELESIPASQIESIEIDYLAGVSENANARGGVIKVKLKKEKQGGYSGYFRGTASVLTNYGYQGESLNNSFSARYGKLSIRNNILYSHRLFLEDAYENHFFKLEENRITSTAEMRDWKKRFYDRLSLTYDFSKKHSLGFSGLYYTDRDRIKTETSFVEDETEHLSLLKSPTSRDKYQAVLNYAWKIKRGCDFSVTADYLRNDLEVNQKEIVDKGNDRISHTTQQTDMLRVRPFFTTQTKHGELSLGGEMQYVDYEDYIRNTSETEGLVSTMKGYQPALYANYSSSYKQRLRYEVGIRYQGNLMDVKTMDVTNENKDWGFCPMVSLMYMANPQKGHILSLQYKRMMEELPYSVISTYKQYESPQTYVVGNPALVSPTTDQLMAMIGLFNKITFMAGCVRVSDQIYYATEIDPETSNISYIIPRNGDSQTAFMFGLEGNLKPFKWWQMKANVNMAINSAKTDIYHVKGQERWSFSLNNDFDFGKTFGGTLSAQYEPDSHYLDAMMKSVCSVYGSVYKNFFKNQLECKLDFTLYRKGREIITDTKEYTLAHLNDTKEQKVALSLTWHFKGGKKVKVSQGAKSIQDYYEYTNDKQQ